MRIYDLYKGLIGLCPCGREENVKKELIVNLVHERKWTELKKDYSTRIHFQF